MQNDGDNVIPIPGMDDTPAPAANEAEHTLNVEDMASYVLVGITKDGRHARAVSAGMTLEELSDHIGRLKLMLQIESVQAGMHNFAQAREAAARAQRVIRPGM